MFVRAAQLTLIALFVLPMEVLAIGGTVTVNCHGLYNKLGRQYTEGAFLTPELMAQIRMVLNDPKLNPRQRAKQIFTLKIDAMLAATPEKFREEAIYVLRNRQYVPPHMIDESLTSPIGAKVDTIMMGAGEKMYIAMPDELRETSLEYVQLVHETMHVLSKLRTPGFQKLFRNVMFPANTLFHEEKLAMLAEHAYISQIPKADRLELAQKIKNNKDFAKNKYGEMARNFFVQILESADKPAEEYIEAMHQAGRYNRRQTYAFSSARTREVLAGSLALGTGYFFACASLDPDSGSQALIKKICPF